MLGAMARTILTLLLLAGIVWWWTGPSSDELRTYPASCANGISILPPSLALQDESFGAMVSGESEGYKKYQADRANCVILHHSPKVYKINKARAEVYYSSKLDGAKRLVDCSIFSRTDWACSYPDGSGKLVIIDGLKAIHADDVDNAYPQRFSLRRWQWWTVVLLWWIGDPRGAWLIPEQHEYHKW